MSVHMVAAKNIYRSSYHKLLMVRKATSFMAVCNYRLCESMMFGDFGFLATGSPKLFCHLIGRAGRRGQPRLLGRGLGGGSARSGVCVPGQAIRPYLAPWYALSTIPRGMLKVEQLVLVRSSVDARLLRSLDVMARACQKEGFKDFRADQRCQISEGLPDILNASPQDPKRS